MSEFSVSFEFFPPRDAEGRTRLVHNVASKLAEFGPEFYSVTYGAGGSTRDGTRQTVEALLEAGRAAVPHLSLGTDDREAIHTLLDGYARQGIHHIVSLRGDQPSGLGAPRFDANAEALIRVIRAHSGDRFRLIVAAYPETHPAAAHAEEDLHYFKRKVEAGADRAITQYFYNADAYEDFLERCACAGIGIPVYAGIMPITNLESLVRFSDRCGAEIPRWLERRLAALQTNDEDLVAFGVEVVSALCEKLRALGAPGLHFYTLNRWGATSRICRQLGFG